MDWELHYPTQEKITKVSRVYASEQHKIDKNVYSTDELHTYAIYKQALDTYKETTDKASEKYSKDLEVLNIQLEKVAKEFKKNIQERATKAEEVKREQVIKKHREEIKGIAYDIKRVDQAIEEEDRLINRAEILALDRALARRYQHKLARHRRVLENRSKRRKEIVKGSGLSLDIAPDEELSDGGYSSIKEFKDKETLPQKHRITKNRVREPYPSLFEYPHQIPTHHTADTLSVNEQQKLQKRIEAKAKQEQEKSNPKKKGKQETSRPVSPVEVRDIQPDTPPQTPTVPRDRRNDKDDEGAPHRNHFWSLRNIPKFEGKGDQPFSHLMEFEDYLVASGMTIEPEEEGGQMVQPDYRDIINKFIASLKNNARVWFSMYIENRVPHLHSADGWKEVKSKFLTYFNPIGSTKEQQIKAWKELTDFVFRFSQLAHELGYSDEQQISHFMLCIPRGMYPYLEGT